MQGFGTDTVAMAAAATTIGTARQTVGAELEMLRDDLGVLRTAWRGAAQREFTEAMERWDANAQKLASALEGISMAVTGSADAYRAVEQQETDNVSAITAVLG